MNKWNEQMTQKGLGEQIGRILCSRTGSIQATSADTERMRYSVHRKMEEGLGVRKWNMKRIPVVAAATCILGIIATVTTGKVVYTSSGNSHLNDFTYDKLRGMGTRLSYTTNIPKTFSNGCRSDMGMPIRQGIMDQDGDVIRPTKGFSLGCKKGENLDVFATVQGTSLYDEEEQPDQTFNHNRTTLNYTRDQYRFVPPGYQASDEGKAKKAAEELCISYGSDKVQSKVTRNMFWKGGEKVYIITAMDNPMTVRDITRMAEGLMDNRQ